MAVQLIEHGTDIADEHRRLVERITRVMRFTDEPMTIGDLAETAGLSPFYFTRIFRQYAGIPPGEFQTALRFERAKHLLLTSPASITEICFEVGYGSLGTFSARFKHLVGVGPAEFRNLPDIVNDLKMDHEVNRSFSGKPGPSAEVHGTINRPPGASSNVFIGIFPDYIAASRPVKGMMVPDRSSFVLPEIPHGTWRVLAAAVPHNSDPLVQLLPMQHAMVATGGLVTVRTGAERFHVSLNLHPPIPSMPPVLTALPALLL